MAIKTYDPSDVLTTLNGVILGGFADGTFLAVDKAEDTYSVAVGATGATTRVRNRNNSGTVTVVLQASSNVNDLLSSIHTFDLLTNSGKGPFLVKDIEGTTIITGADAWIKKIPAVDFSKDMPTRTWVIECSELLVHVGGLL